MTLKATSMHVIAKVQIIYYLIILIAKYTYLVSSYFEALIFHRVDPINFLILFLEYKKVY